MQTDINNIAFVIDFSNDCEPDEMSLCIIDKTKCSAPTLDDKNPLNTLGTSMQYLGLESPEDTRKHIHLMVDQFFDMLMSKR